MDAPTNIEDLAIAAHESLTIRFGTDAPYAFEKVRCEKIGFAGIPCVVIGVTCRGEDLDAMIPIARQRVSRELAERGWSLRDLKFVPNVLRGRRRRFVDENETSETRGLNKFGVQHDIRFEMERELAALTFVGGGSFKQLPDKP